MTPPPSDRTAADGDMTRDGKITRDVLLAAALEIIDRDGAGGLSMRRLARAVNRDPMVLYRHAPNKAALLDGVAEIVLAQLKVDPADPDWAGQLRAVARDYRALALAHPHVVPLLVTRPLATPLALRPTGTLRPLEDVLALLTPAASTGPTPCTSTVPCSASCTATSSTNCKNSSTIPTRPTTCCAWACTGCRLANSRCCAVSPRSWPPTTAPPNSNEASTSSWTGWPPPGPADQVIGYGRPAQRQALRVVALPSLIDVFHVQASVDVAASSAGPSPQAAAPPAGRPVRIAVTCSAPGPPCQAYGTAAVGKIGNTGDRPGVITAQIRSLS